MGTQKDSKALFKTFSEIHKNELPFCLHYEWWNSVVKDQWEVLCIHEGNDILSVWPYYYRQKGPWKIICNPPLTPYSGPYIKYPEQQKAERRIAFENKLYHKYISLFPDFALFDLNLPLYFKNSLAFHWNGFTDRKRFTYLIDLSIEEDQLWQNLKESTRRQIKKAKKTLKLEKHWDAKRLEADVQSSFEHQGANYPIQDQQLVSNVLDYAAQHKCGQLSTAYEGEKAHASLFMMTDQHTAYYLMGGAQSDSKNSGALSLLMWEAILSAKVMGLKSFNTEGSSHPKIEPFLRGFGGELTPFSNLYKEDSTFFKLAKQLKP